jgi:hypothetical protein
VSEIRLNAGEPSGGTNAERFLLVLPVRPGPEERKRFPRFAARAEGAQMRHVNRIKCYLWAVLLCAFACFIYSGYRKYRDRAVIDEKSALAESEKDWEDSWSARAADWEKDFERYRRELLSVGADRSLSRDLRLAREQLARDGLRLSAKSRSECLARAAGHAKRRAVYERTIEMHSWP